MNHLPLWNQLKNGEKKALEQIYRHTVQLLYRYGCRFTNDQQLVEDCIQDLFIELWQNREKLGNTSSIERYLLASIRRKVIRQLSRTKKIKLSEDGHEYSFSVEMAIDEKLIGIELNDEQMTSMKLAFDQLSKRQKEAIYLKFYAGLEYDEIQDVMNISYQSARNLVSGGLKKMKQTVGNIQLVYLITKILEILST